MTKQYTPSELEWKPIEEAPKVNYNHYLLCLKDYKDEYSVYVGKYSTDNKRWVIYTDHGEVIAAPTYFLPLGVFPLPKEG